MSNMKIDHIALYCLDLEGMREFFIRYFNGVSNEMYHNPKTGLKTYILSFPDSDARLELMTRPEVVEENIYRQGFIHLSFSVGSEKMVDSLTKVLNEDGYQVLSGPRTTGDGYYESCIVGPEKILIEITV
jgi:lactoylglutathione lyase